MNWPYISPEERRITMVSVPLDVILSVPMFLRAYLLCRFMVLHSKQFQDGKYIKTVRSLLKTLPQSLYEEFFEFSFKTTFQMDAATRSIAALNRISMDFRFVIKTMMADHPLTVLVVFTVSYWICMSWMFTQCERYNGRFTADHYYLNSLWFVTVSFLSVGYGDIVPSTYCGRMLAITTGIVGAGVSSALIAVISRKLELSRAEKHVNNFMADSKLTNQRKNAAASVLQQTWFIHKYQRSANKGDDLRLRHHQRKFLNAINDFRRIKWDQRKLQERGNSLLDVGKLHNEMHETLWEMHRTQDQFISQIDMLTQRIMELQSAVLGQQQQQQPNNGPPQYSRQYSGGGGNSTLQVPGTSASIGIGTIDNNLIHSSAETMKVPSPGISGLQGILSSSSFHDHGLSHSQSQHHHHQHSSRSQDNGDETYSDYFTVRTGAGSPEQTKNLASTSIDEQSPLISR
uniref:Calmodulin-binding domain-containing protein n=1 Tax=Panagrolaimus sp. PS1159 TaxID=55785 RepID=A0AC35FTN7_9BILA